MKDDFHNYLPIVMFRGTPCRIPWIYSITVFKKHEEISTIYAIHIFVLFFNLKLWFIYYPVQTISQI